jgi:TRAP-type mannitol/chloroaromatic compound transport system substrate-binding protein
MECFVNAQAYNQLPADLKSIVEYASRVANQNMMQEFTTRNHDALEMLINEHSVEMREFPQEVLDKFRQLSQQVVEELVGDDPFAREIYDSYQKFLSKSKAWFDVSERAYLNIR